MTATWTRRAILLGLLACAPASQAFDRQDARELDRERAPLDARTGRQTNLPSILSGAKARLGWAVDLPDNADLSNQQLPPPYRDFEINYLPRDAQLLIGQPSGGYGVVTMGKASDYTGGAGAYHVSSGYGCFQISDVPGTGQYAYAECLYSEVARTADGASAVGHEIAMPNYAGYPPTINPFQVNNNGWQAHLQLDPGGGSHPKRDFWPSSALIAAPNFGGQALRGVVFGSTAIAGSNGSRNVSTTIRTVAGERVAVLPASPQSLGIVVGQAAQSKHVPAGAIVTAAFTTGNRIELSAPATEAGEIDATFANTGAVALELAPHHEIRWTNDTYGARGAFIRNDSAAGEVSLGLRFHANGIAWVNARSEVEAAGVTNDGDSYARRFLSVGGAPTVRDCGKSPPAPHPHSTPAAGQFQTGARATGCTIDFAAPFPTAAFCVVTPTNATAAKSGYFVSVSENARFRLAFAAAVDGAGFNYACGGK